MSEVDKKRIFIIAALKVAEGWEAALGVKPPA
jgi:hypothetical protein